MDELRLRSEKQFDERLTNIVIPKTRAFTSESRDLARIENIKPILRFWVAQRFSAAINSAIL